MPFFPDAKLSRLKLEAVELSVLALAAAVALAALAVRRMGRPPRALSIAVLSWTGVNAALWALSPDRALATGEFARVATSAAAFFAVALAGLDARWVRRFLLCWSVAAGLLSIYGLMQFFGGAGPVIVPRLARPIGTFGNPIFFSAFLVPSLFLGAAAWRGAGPAGRRMLVIILLLEGAAVVLTQTRSAYLALAGAVVAFAAVSGRVGRMRWAAVAVLIACAAAVGLIGSRDQAHALIWRDTVKLWQQAPLTGVGLGAFHVRFPDAAGDDLKAKWPAGRFIVNYAHNEYLQVLAEGGPAALAAFIAILIAFKLQLRRAAEPVARLIGAAALAGFIQNLASADFRFGVSQAGAFLLMGLFATRTADGSAASVTLPHSARPAAALALAGLAGLAGARLTWYAGQRGAAAAPGFFDERIADPARAISDLETRADRRRGNPDDLEQLAFAYAKEMRRPDGTADAAMAAKAVDAFRRVLALAPDRATAHNNLGNVLFTMGNAAAADPEWRSAADLDPRYIDPRLNLGKAAYVRGDLKEAARWFQNVLTIDPANAEAALYLRRMVE